MSDYPSDPNRRRFLRNAALGTLGATAAAAVGGLGDGARADAASDGEVHAFQGALVDRSRTALQVQLSPTAGVRSAVLTSATSFWKGGASRFEDLAVGDDVLVRVSGPQQTTERVWANHVRLQGHSAGSIRGGFRLAVGHADRPSREIDIFTDSTNWRDLFTDAHTVAPASVPVGLSVDLIGEKTASGVRATLLAFALPGAVGTPRTNGTASQRVVSASGLCTWYTMGPASYYDCPTGAGRCGTCSTGRDDQTAYPALDSFCNCCDSNCCNCSRNCRNQVYTSCGHIITVVDWCASRQRIFDIVDCGPCQTPSSPCNCPTLSVCNFGCFDCGGGTPTGTIVDLTRPTFTVWYDPALQRCFTCQTQISVSC